MMATTESYQPHASGEHCAYYGADPGHPCWGQVKVVDTENDDRGDEERTWFVLACPGHAAKVLKGWREPYVREPENKQETS